MHFVFLCIHFYRHETELAEIRERGDGRLRRLIALACFAADKIDSLPWSHLSDICADLTATIPVDFVLRQIELIWPGLLPMTRLDVSDEEYKVNAKAIRFGQATQTWDVVGVWQEDYVERIFDLNRWEQLVALEDALRKKNISRRLESARSPGGTPIGVE